MIVVAIIGILAAVAVPKFAEMIRKSKEGSTKGALSALRSALTIYMSDNEGIQPLSRNNPVDPSNEQLTVAMVPRYIEEIPTMKLGAYHSDTSFLQVTVTTGNFDGTKSSGVSDLGGWVFTSGADGKFWANCSHTDTKEENITAW